MEVDYCTDNNCVNGACQSNYTSSSYTCVCNEGWAGQTCDQCTLSSCTECSASPLVCISCHGDHVVSSNAMYTIMIGVLLVYDNYQAMVSASSLILVYQRCHVVTMARV